MALVTFTHAGDVGVVTIDNPPLNLLTRELLAGLDQAVESVANAPVRAVLVRAAGRHFGAGADAGDVFDGVRSDQARPMLTRWMATLHLLETLPVPVVAQVQGMCVGGALEIALHCDLIVAAQSANFGHLEANLGTVTLLGGAQRIAERAGPARAREFVYTAALYDATTCREWGIVNRVVADEDLADAAMGLARCIAAGPTKSHGATKRLIRAYLEGGIGAADSLLPELASIYDTADMQHAVAVILEHGARDLAELTSFVGR